MFDEITASRLVLIDQDCNKLRESPFPVNPAGRTIHSCIHAVRDDAGCVLHTHSRAGVAVSAQRAGLLPLSQQSTLCWTRWPTTTTKASRSTPTKSRACRPTWAALNLSGPGPIAANAQATQATQAATAGQGARLAWPALLRKLDRENPGYDS